MAVSLAYIYNIDTLDKSIESLFVGYIDYFCEKRLVAGSASGCKSPAKSLGNYGEKPKEEGEYVGYIVRLLEKLQELCCKMYAELI